MFHILDLSGYFFLVMFNLIYIPLFPTRTSLVAQMVKCLPTRRETRLQSLGWEDLLEKEMATHSSIQIKN